ncbi:MAG: cyclohexanone monooxygenase [Rhodobacterales bacterium]|nr:MAG: cyclohexanone monooxygenase [Rhodobacterales bacterium]
MTRKVDAIVIGAGVSGLYQIHQLREQGFEVQGLEAGSDVGGTWYWNRYPGARFDSESYIYQYLFDEKLYKDWTWSERFPAQPEIERWMHYIADRLDLRRSIRFDTRVKSAVFNEDTGRWLVTPENGETYDAQFVIGCTGMLSAPLANRFKGQESFRGEIVHTGLYPKGGLDLKGKRVGVIGTGATGIQVIQTIARDVAELKVFVRSPQFSLPMRNPKFGPDEVRAYKGRFDELKETLPNTFTGFEYDFEVAWADLTPEQRLERLEEIYNDGSLKLWLASFSEMFFEQEVSDAISQFVREKMEARLKDPELIKTLVPQPGDAGFGKVRVPLETNYLETYLLPHVEAVRVRDNPIAEIVPEGIKLEDGSVYELDVIIMAVGFDAGTGGMSRIDITGRNGMTLRDEWHKETRTTLGMQVYGFPNLFMTGAPLAPSAALCNMTTCLQQQTEWITDCIRFMREKGKTVIEPTEKFEREWINHHDELVNASLFANTDSWYNGSNIEGKPKRFLSYTGGTGTYKKKCQEIADSGYAGFEIA